MPFIPQQPNGEFIGLTGFAFHPLFNDDRSKRFLYVRYNENNQPNNYRMVIKRFTIPPGMLTADPNSGEVIYSNDTATDDTHTGGYIQFDTRTLTGEDPPYYLYFGTGDNAHAQQDCCEQVTAQETFVPGTKSTHWGKLLRVNVEDYNGSELVPEALAKGLRNPWAISVDRGDSAQGGQGDVWISTTGGTMAGDVFRWTPGTAGVLNYGWPWWQGDGGQFDGTNPGLIPRTCGDTCLDPGGNTYTDPIRTLTHDITENGTQDALLGGYVYRGTGTYKDHYFYASHGCAGNTPGLFAVPVPIPPNQTTAVLTGLSGIQMDLWPGNSCHGLGQDSAGDIYVIRVLVGPNEDTTIGNGTVYKLNQ